MHEKPFKGSKSGKKVEVFATFNFKTHIVASPAESRYALFYLQISGKNNSKATALRH
jgi:hypothetical protein